MGVFWIIVWKTNIEKCVKLVNGWIINVMTKTRCYKEGEQMLVDLQGPFRLIKERKEDSMHFESLIKSFESIVDITRKVSSLMSLVAFIVFNNSFRVENHIYWASKWNIISERVMTQKPCSSGQASSRCYLEPKYTSVGLQSLLSIHLRVIRKQLFIYN